MSNDIEERKTVKKTVVLHPIMDQYVRKTWAILIDEGCDATYSTALNFMLLAAIAEATKDGGLCHETRNHIWAFVEDQETLQSLNLQDHLIRLRELWGSNR